MERMKLLKKRQAILKEDICANLDLLMGTINKSPAMKYPSLTTKIDGKSVSKYVPKGIETKAKKMTLSHKNVRSLIVKLSNVNWEILKLEIR